MKTDRTNTDDDDASQKSRKRASQQARAFVGLLTEEDYDLLSYEEEFETFERFRPAKDRRDRRE